MDIEVQLLEKDENIQIQQLTPEYLEDAIDMMGNAFFSHENVCRAVGVSKDPLALAELKELTRSAAKDGVTVIAIDRTTNKVVGASFNKIQVKGSTFFADIAKNCKQPSSEAVVKFMFDVDSLCDLFEHCKVDCLMELMFLATLPEYRGKGIAKKLAEMSLLIGQKLNNGINVKISVDGRILHLTPTPAIASAIFTSFVTQKIARQLEFEIGVEKSYEEFYFEGKSYASLIGKETPTLTLEYKRFK